MRYALVLLVCCLSSSAKEDAKVLTPAEAAKKVGEVATVEFTVKFFGVAIKDPVLILGSLKDYGDKDFFSAAVKQSVLKQLEKQGVKSPPDAEKMYMGKTIRVTGKIERRGGKLEIVVEDEKNLVLQK